MRRELESYALRHVRRPLVNGRYLLVASTVAARGPAGEQYYCYVSFSDRFVKFVGKVMPRGVMESDPAFIYVETKSPTCFDMYAISAKDGKGVHLWHTVVHPEWLKFITVKVEHGNHKKAGRPASNACDSSPGTDRKGARQARDARQ